MRRVAVLLAARGFAGVAADAVVSSEVKTMLLVAIGIIPHRRIFIDTQRTAFRQRTATQIQQIDFHAVTIVLFRFAVVQFGVRLFAGAHFKHALGFVKQWFRLSTDLVQTIAHILQDIQHKNF